MKQGEIWQIGLDPAIGAEMKKTRPALIINVDALGKLPLKIIAPTKQNGLVKLSAVDCFQVRSIAIERFVIRIGFVEPEIITQVQEAISKVIGAL